MLELDLSLDFEEPGNMMSNKIIDSFDHNKALKIIRSHLIHHPVYVCLVHRAYIY